MRILWLSHLLPYPPKGGVLQRSHNLLKQASSWGDVHLVALRQRSIHPTPEARDEAVTALRRFCTAVDVFDIPSDTSKAAWLAMTALNFFRAGPYDAAWLRSPGLLEFVRDRVNLGEYDVVHVDTIGLMQYVPETAYSRVVLNHHNIESQMMARRADRESSWLRRAYFRVDAHKLARLERAVCPGVGMNVVVSELDADRLTAGVGPVLTTVVDNGVDIDYFVPRTAPEAREGLAFAGGMSWYPNREAMEYFVREILPLVRSAHADLPVTIVGKDPTPAVQRAGKQPGVRVTGWVDDVRPYLDRAAIYVCPIRDGGGTRLKILDALAMAKPLVATEMAVEGLDLAEGEHYLRAETPEEFRDQISRLIEDPGLCQELSERGRVLVEDRYSWNVIGRKLHSAYGSVNTKTDERT